MRRLISIQQFLDDSANENLDELYIDPDEIVEIEAESEED